MKNATEIHTALDRLLQRHVAFFPVFAQIGGSVNAGVMLSQLWYWSDGRGWNKEGWIWKTSSEWAAETMLTESEVESARKKLIDKGFIQYKRAGIPAKPHYFLNKLAVLDAVISLEAQCASLPKSGKQDCPNPPNKPDEKQDSGLPENGKHNTETTSDTTPYTTPTAGGAGVEITSSPKTPVWKEGAPQSGEDDFVSASLWLAQKSGGVRSPVGFKSKVRGRIASEGPNAEDWETLALWRAAQSKPVATKNAEDTKLAAEKKQQLADAKQRFAAAGMAHQKEIEARFAVQLEATNSFAYKVYLKSGLNAGVVAGAFHEWLVKELQEARE